MSTQIRRTDEFDVALSRLTDERAKSRINIAVQRMEDGNFGDWKYVGGGVSETRIDYGPGYRVYYARRGEALVILLLCGDKSMQRRDIARAIALAASC